MELIVIPAIILFVTPLLLLRWSWKALLAYVLIIGCPLTWLWIDHFYVTSQPDFTDTAAAAGFALVFAQFYTFLFIFGIVLSVLLVGLYKRN